MADAGHAMADIRQRVEKQDHTHPSLRCVAEIVARHREDPSWRGEDSSAGGRPRLLTVAEEQAAVKLVFDERGSAKVTVPYCRKRLPFLRRVSEQTARLRQRLDASAPEKIETRGMFIRRLRRTVTWMNDNLADDGRHLCTNQKERAAEILLLKGAKCKF